MSAITESARGQQCQIRLEGICNHDPETTVLAHANGSAAGKGIGMKAIDVLSAYSCSACHDEYDRRTRKLEKDYVTLCFWEGHARTLRILAEKGLVRFE